MYHSIIGYTLYSTTVRSFIVTDDEYYGTSDLAQKISTNPLRLAVDILLSTLIIVRKCLIKAIYTTQYLNYCAEY